MGEINFSPIFKEILMKLTITKSSGTKLIKEFKAADIEAAKANGWKEVDKPKAKTPAKAKEKK